MNWNEAVAAMKTGAMVRRKSEMQRKQIADDIFESGEEACRLMHAWTDEEKPALVFMGVGSKTLFVPEDDHRNAVDWIVVEPGVSHD